MPKLASLRRCAYIAQEGRCFYCGFWMWLPATFADSADRYPGLRRPEIALLQCTAEHLLPRAQGGLDTKDNIVAACLRCNGGRHKLKRAPSPESFRLRVGKRVRQGRWHHRSVMAFVEKDSQKNPQRIAQLFERCLADLPSRYLTRCIVTAD